MNRPKRKSEELNLMDMVDSICDMTDRDPKLGFCYSCLNDDQSVEFYTFHESFQTIISEYGIPLCRYCKQVAQNAEKFISNIECNQTWVHRPIITTELVKQRKTQYQRNLHIFTPKVCETGTQTVELLLENEPKPVCDSGEIKVKHEGVQDDDFNNECMDEDIGNVSEPFKKEEDDVDDYPLMKLKTELSLQGVEIKRVEKEKPNVKPVEKEKPNVKRVVKEKQKVKTVEKENPKGRKRKKRTCFTQRKKKKIVKETSVSIDTSMDDNGVDGNKRRRRKWPGIEVMRLTTEQAKQALEEKLKGINAIFKCTDCVKGFNFKDKFDKHMEKHDMKSGPHKCQFCTQRFQSKNTYENHLKRHSIRYRCKVCGKNGASGLMMWDHYEIAHGTAKGPDSYEPYKCNQCPKCFKGRQSLYAHMRYSHKDHEQVICQHCNKIFRRKEGLQKHLYMKHPETVVPDSKMTKKNVCDECGNAFDTPYRLKQHMVRHKPNKDFYCVECDRNFKSQKTLDGHLKTSLFHLSNPNVLPYACGDCNKRFIDKRVLSRHMNIAHLNVRPYKCDQCKNTYTDLYYLKKHIKLKHSGYEPPRIFQCTMCDRSFKHKRVLDGHIRTHTGERPFQCTVCSAAFGQSSSLGTHLKLIHKVTRDGKPIKTTHKGVLKGHIRTHTGERPYQCSVCSAAFGQSSSLGTHLKLIHKVTRDGKPIKTTHKGVLKGHIRTHTGERPYQCSVCSAAFGQSSSLGTHLKLIHKVTRDGKPIKTTHKFVLEGHIRTHTGERPFQCSVCSAAFGQSSSLGTHFKLIHLKLNRDGKPKDGN